MAQIVLGLGTSHGPQILTPPEHWRIREEADRENQRLFFRGQSYTFDELAEVRKGDALEERQTIAARRVHHARCQIGRETLADIFERAAIDVAVILGNDQFEVFTEVNIPAFGIFWGDHVSSIPKTPEQKAMIPAGAAFAEDGYNPPVLTDYPGQPDLGKHLIEQFIANAFDVAQSTRLPVGRMGNNSVPHAYGYIYRQVMRDKVVPHVPIMINTHNPPNRPTGVRCLQFGQTLAEAIDSWSADLRVAIIASGGLTHFVIDEALDRGLLEAVQAGDVSRIAMMPESSFESGTAEIKNWLPLIGAMTHAGLSMTVVDYVPCYRSEAGTGNAMCFAYWAHQDKPD